MNWKKSRVIALVFLVISVVLLAALIIYLDVKPNHHHRTDNNQVVVFLKFTMWVFGFLGGGLLSWANALRSRTISELPLSRKPALSILGILLILWSIDRLLLGVAPEGPTIFGARPGIWYGFPAVVAAVISFVTVTNGSFLFSKGLIGTDKLTS